MKKSSGGSYSKLNSRISQAPPTNSTPFRANLSFITEQLEKTQRGLGEIIKTEKTYRSQRSMHSGSIYQYSLKLEAINKNLIKAIELLNNENVPVNVDILNAVVELNEQGKDAIMRHNQKPRVRFDNFRRNEIDPTINMLKALPGKLKAQFQKFNQHQQDPTLQMLIALPGKLKDKWQKFAEDRKENRGTFELTGGELKMTTPNGMGLNQYFGIETIEVNSADLTELSELADVFMSAANQVVYHTEASIVGENDSSEVYYPKSGEFKWDEPNEYQAVDLTGNNQEVVKPRVEDSRGFETESQDDFTPSAPRK